MNSSVHREPLVFKDVEQSPFADWARRVTDGMGITHQAFIKAGLHGDANALLGDFIQFFRESGLIETWGERTYQSRVLRPLVLSKGPREGELNLQVTENMMRNNMQRFVRPQLAPESTLAFDALMDRWAGLVSRQAEAEQAIRAEKKARSAIR